MEFIQSVLAHDVTPPAGLVDNWDLPVHPLSHILITLKMARLDKADTDIPPFADIPARLARIEVLYKGSAVYSLNGLDCLASSIFVNKFESWGINAVDIEDAEWSFTFLVPMTRVLYSPTECFPRTTRGELILQITYAAAGAEFDDMTAYIETIELPDASPTQFLKQTTKTCTPTATGQYDIELPIGNDISDLILWGETIPCNAADLATLQHLEILVDNINHFFPESHFDVIHDMAGRLRAAPGYWGYHTHKLIVPGLSAGQQVSRPKPGNHILSNHLHMPFDIFKNGEYALKTAGASDVCLRVDCGVAADQIRCIPCEIVPSAGAV